MEEEDNERMEEDATSSLLIDLYCHEDPILFYCHEDPLLSTPPSMTTPAAACGPHGDADHQQQVQDLLDDDDDSLLMMADYMVRQRCYAPSTGYLDSLVLSASDPDGLSCARAKGLHYVIYAFGRLGLAAATAFNAVNYLDRFLSINCHLQRWETWMVELVSLACLSIACKLDEVDIPSLHHLQMEEVMSHSFRPETIRDMELTLLKALQWRISCVTPFSFLQLLITCTAAAAVSRCTRLLMRSLSETSLLRFDPSVIASTALRCVVLQDHHLQDNVSGHISFLTRPECPLVTAMKQDKDSDECYNTMKALYASMDHQMCSSDQHLSPSSVIPFGTVVNRSAVGRCLFGRSIIPHQISTEDEDSIPPADIQGVK